MTLRQARNKRYRTTHREQLSAKAKAKRRSASKKVGGRFGPNAARTCECNRCSLCIHREHNKAHRDRKRLGLAKKYVSARELERRILEKPLR